MLLANRQSSLEKARRHMSEVGPLVRLRYSWVSPVMGSTTTLAAWMSISDRGKSLAVDATVAM